MNMQDQISTLNDITERALIVTNYWYYGIFDKNKAIDKIIEFKLSNTNILSAMLIEQMRNLICYSYYSDMVIIQELIREIDYLQRKSFLLNMQQHF